ncbi:MAG TPA: citrate/2-methylcitrate synthase [Armatimonadota bacterium]
MSNQGETTAPQVVRGLEGVVAAATQIAEVNGKEGKLTLRGYDIRELAGRVTFEEVAYLLWHGDLPNRSEYSALQRELVSFRELQAPTLEVLKVVSPQATGMHALRMGAATLSIGYPDADSLDASLLHRRAARLQAQMPALVAHSWRLRQGLEPIEPLPQHGYAEGFLYMLEGKEPSRSRVDALNSYLVAICEHGLNASTFTARQVISTDSDMISALTAAVGSLKGPKHGGVPGPVLNMLNDIGSPHHAEEYIRKEQAAGRRIMGFGHRIYKTRDPRAAILEDAAEKLAKETGDRSLLELCRAVEKTTVKVLNELHPDRALYANVELYAALVLHGVGIPPEIFTPMFAIGRTAGWTAHMIEQLDDNRLIRPDSIYVGPHDLRWRLMDERS